VDYKSDKYAKEKAEFASFMEALLLACLFGGLWVLFMMVGE
jgi:hypothetical protein